MNVKLLSVAVVAAVSLFGCGLDLVGPKCGGAPGPKATASLSAVTLAQDCGAKAGVADFAAGACAAEGPCGLCRQSSMQLQFASAHRDTVKIIDVRLLDLQTGKLIEHLKPREPQSWNGSQYVTWDETLEPTVMLKASYKLSAPTYSVSGDARFGYTSTYKVEVDVMIGDELHTLTGEASREPEVVT